MLAIKQEHEIIILDKSEHGQVSVQIIKQEANNPETSASYKQSRSDSLTAINKTSNYIGLFVYKSKL